MKKLISIKEILVTILISYLGISYINNTINPFELKASIRVLHIIIIGGSLILQAISNDLNNDLNNN
jgi:hypothetical protein